MSTIGTATMTMKRTTKGAVLYENAKQGQTITTIYLRKDGLAQPFPGEIAITVTRLDDD
jgi:hypothetical protein